MGMPAARLGDFHVCPMVTGTVPHVGGPLMPPTQATVITGKKPQARVGDMASCAGPTDMIALGAFTVMVVGSFAARLGDTCAHGGKIVLGEFTVLIGDNGASAGSMGKMGFVPPKMKLEAPHSDAKAQVEAMTYAAKYGKPFCEQCARAAAAAGQG
ncbi:MAG: PAAR domain-containing protein [Sphingomonadales bacterium]|nr:PAAR domain-containing protein [Sphingomonadales bacterium]